MTNFERGGFDATIIFQGHGPPLGISHVQIVATQRTDRCGKTILNSFTKRHVSKTSRFTK